MALALKGLGELPVRGRIGLRGLNGGAELGDGGVEVATVHEAFPGVGGELSSLQVGRVGAKGSGSFGLFGRSSGVALLAQDGGERGVRSGKVRLEAQGLA